MVLTVASCGEQSAESVNISAVPESVSVMSKDKPDDNITVTDQLGRKVTISGKINRIVSGYYITTSMLIALGLQDKIVGVEAKAKSRPIYSLSAPQILKLPNVGTAKQFDHEGCLALKPDLVILPLKLKESVEELDRLGIKVLGVNPENMELLKETISLIGKATGTDEKALKLITYYDDKMKDIQDATRNENHKKVYLAGNSALLSTATSKMYQNTLIKAAGGENVAAGINDTYWAAISYEQLISFNPDIIIIVPFAEYSKDDVLNDKKLQGLNAIKNKTVYKMPEKFEAWDSPVPSGILGIMWLESILNENEYSFDTFKSDAVSFYKNFYNIDINKEDITK